MGRNDEAVLRDNRRDGWSDQAREEMEMKQKSILDRDFHYTSAAATDLKKTFARIRRQMEQEKRERDQKVSVMPVGTVKGGKRS